MSKIERMFHSVFVIAEILFVLWPLVVLMVIFTMYRGPGGIRGTFHRLVNSLLITWLVLLAIWIIGQFDRYPIPVMSPLPEPENTLIFFSGLALLLILKFLPALLKWLKTNQRLREIKSIQQLKSMAPDQFEELVAATYRGLGYRAKRVGHSGDHGVDVLMRGDDGQKWIVQCKRYRDTVGEAIIRELYGTMVSEKAARAIMVTTAQITQPAEIWARGKPIDLIDGFGLLRLMAQARARSEERRLVR